MFRPPSLLAPLVVPTATITAAGQLGLLHPGLLCFVTSAHTGYANRPNTGNGRYRDSHPARLPALSAAHCCPRQLPDVIPENFPWMLDPVPRRYTVCSRLFPSTASSAFPKEKIGSASRV